MNRSLRKRLLAPLLACCLLVLHCDDGAPDEDYGDLDPDSVNGFTAIEAEAEKIAERVLRSSYLSRRMRREADVILYLERDPPDSPRYYLYLESWLQRMSSEALKQQARDPELYSEEENVENDLAPPSEEAPAEEEEGAEEDSDSTVPSDAEVYADSESEAQSETAGESESENDSEDDSESDEVMADEPHKTVLYFLRDTDASLALWQMLESQMGAVDPQRAYCQMRLEYARHDRENAPERGEAPFGALQVADQAGAVRAVEYFDREVFSQRPSPWPLRHAPAGVPSLQVSGEALFARPLLIVDGGVPVIRQFEFSQARLLLISNTEPFLNFWMVRPANRAMARELLNYAAVAARQSGRKPVIGIVRAGLTPVQQAAQNEVPFLRFLTVYPLNLIFLHFAALLFLYLLSRWPHKRRPLENPPAGRREFMEHIRALGVRLSRVRNPRAALEPLIQYRRRKHGQDIRGSVEEWLKLRSPEEEKLAAPEGESSAANPEKNPYV